MMERDSLGSRSSKRIREAKCWELAGLRMEAESGLEGPVGKSLRDLGRGEEGSGAEIERRNGAAVGAQRLRKGLEATTCGPP